MAYNDAAGFVALMWVVSVWINVGLTIIVLVLWFKLRLAKAEVKHVDDLLLQRFAAALTIAKEGR